MEGKVKSFNKQKGYGFIVCELAEDIFFHYSSLIMEGFKTIDVGAVVEFEKVLLVDNNGEVKVGAPTVEGAKVVCEVLSPLVKGDKVLVFHKKRRKGYCKLNGHRQQFTEVSVKEIVA